MEDVVEKNKKGVEEYKKEVFDAKRLLDYAVSGGWVPGEGQDVDEAIVKAIETAVDSAQNEQLPHANVRTPFEIAYRDLCRLVAPVTVETLWATSPDSNEKNILTPFTPMSRAGCWSRILVLYTALFAGAVLIYEFLNVTLDQFGPATDAEDSWDFATYTQVALSVMMPFIYGGLGACVFLLRSCHIYIHKRTFNPRRIPEYVNRILLGVVSGGVITLFVQEIGGDGDEVLRLSAAALGFLAGYNTEFLFQTLERVTAAILPKVGISSVRTETQPVKSPSPGNTALVVGLMNRYEAAKDEETKALYAEILKKVKDML